MVLETLTELHRFSSLENHNKANLFLRCYDLPKYAAKMDIPNETMHLACEQRASGDPEGMLCVALAHNEAHILPQFLEHYRSIGVKQFVIVDDHSTDDTWKTLSKQNDVSVYKPKPGSTYKGDKVAWRCDLLDQMADQRWVLLPDIDEHMIYPHMEKCALNRLTSHLDDEGAQVVFTVMVDMYADKPLKDHHINGGNLIEAFPFFDNPSDPTNGYRLMPPATRFLQQFPTPPICAYGGVRDRMFFRENQAPSFLIGWLLRKFANFKRPLVPGPLQKITNSITRRLTKNRFGPDPFSMTKIGMVKWQKGMKLPGGPHAVSKKLKLSATTAAYLHFNFTKGVKGVEYVAKRGQHAGDSTIYHQILDQIDLFELSPLYEGSIRFKGPQSFIDCGLIRVGTLEMTSNE